MTKDRDASVLIEITMVTKSPKSDIIKHWKRVIKDNPWSAADTLLAVNVETE